MDDQQQAVKDEAGEVAWWMRWLATVAGVIGGITACFGGFFGLFKGAISLDAVEFIGYAIMLFLGFLIFVMEATFVCRPVSFAQPIIARMDRIRFWHRGAMYCSLSMISYMMLASNSPFGSLGSIIVPFATGVLYGLMALGRKADREQMLANAARSDNYQQFENEEP
ncbi:unnamed protein product [Oikopleura dioica]|uniref:Calcium channel flower n=1 Tax=Oikopleura dioica TaxID=34765 RepID=E4XKT3_OIKDI|nr:unnamed protein product [Oikopleura dioica]CBY35239.1 unnamed protein product [Oikopleura dioica]